jgi:general secretion pathway protein K
VILALLTVALVAGLAAAAVGDLGVAMDQVTGRHDQAQARQLARGAVDWARNVLAEDARRSNVDHLGEAWAVKVPPTPVEEGEVSGELQDLSGRINLNKLVQIDGPTLQERDQFLRLLKLLGVETSEALDLTNALIDWLDRNDSPACPAAPNPPGTAPSSPPQPGQRAAGQRW